MALKAILNKQTDFTGEFPEEWAKSGLWRFNEFTPDDDTSLKDSSGNGRNFVISGWKGTTASLPSGYKGHYFRFNTNAPATEKTYLKAENDGTIFENIGERIIVGGWIRPTVYSIDNTYCPIFNTRQGPGHPIFYVSLYKGRPRLMLYDASGKMLIDQAYTPDFSMTNNGWYFIAAVIEPNAKKMRLCLEMKKLRDWVVESDCRHVAMESTGIYWQPIYEMLEPCFDGEINILVVNARHMKNVPGRKTDMRDAQWIATLLRAGLLKGSFIPDKTFRELRHLTRYRKSVVHDITAQKNRIDNDDHFLVDNDGCVAPVFQNIAL